VFLINRYNRFSKLLDRVGLGKKSGILHNQRGHAICLAVAGRVDHAQAQGLATHPSGAKLGQRHVIAGRFGGQFSKFLGCKRPQVVMRAFPDDVIATAN
jgi:hypothetical protein